MNSQFHEDYLRVSKPRFRIIGVRGEYTLLQPINASAFLKSKQKGWFYFHSDFRCGRNEIEDAERCGSQCDKCFLQFPSRPVIGLYQGQIIKP